MSQAHTEMYFRLGGVILRALRDRLSQIHTVPAPGGQEFRLERITEAQPYGAAWSFQFDVALPNDEGTIMIMVAQVGSGFDERRVTLPLPEEEYENTFVKDFPEAHQAAWGRLVDAVESLLVERGFTHSSSGDFCIYTDYFPSKPSTHMQVAVANPRLLTRDLVRSCQALLQRQHFPFAIRFSLGMDDDAYKEREESLLVRADRVVEDWDTARLKREFGDRFSW